MMKQPAPTTRRGGARSLTCAAVATVALLAPVLAGGPAIASEADKDGTPRLSFGVVGPPPAVASQPFSKFAALFAPEVEESAGNVELQITKCRKLYYDSTGWDLLIPGSSSTPGPRVPNPEEIKVVSTPAGDVVDIGHVCAGLDAANHLAPQGVLEDNLAAVTWLGDLASVLAEDYLWAQRNQGRTPPAEVRQGHINEFAPPEDLLGDVDAYAISAALGVERGANADLTGSLLAGYYDGPDRRAGPSTRDWSTLPKWAHDYRLAFFISRVGLKLSNDQSGDPIIRNQSEWISAKTEALHKAAFLYLLQQGEWSVAAAHQATSHAAAEELLRIFVRDLLAEHVHFQNAIRWDR